MGTKIRFYLTKNPIKEGAVVSFSRSKDWSKVNDIAKGLSTQTPYATAEPDYFVLDGNYKFVPDSWDVMHVGYLGSAISDANRSLPAGESVHVKLATARAVDKITIHGQDVSGDYPAYLLIRYFNNGQILQDKYIYPDSVHFTYSNPVSNVDEIHFTIYRTNKPYRRARITDITFGDVMEFGSADIASAKAVKQVSLIGETLPAGTFSASICAGYKIADVTDSNSLFSRMKDRMAFDVLYDDGSQVRFIGRYYLDGWDNTSDYEIKINGYDLIGLMDQEEYKGDYWQTDADFSAVVGRVLSQMPAIKDFFIDPNIPAINLRGAIATGTIRTALQQAVIAAGLSVSILEPNDLYITYQRWQNLQAPTWTFTKKDKAWDNQPLKLAQPVTRIELTSHNYALSTTSSRVYQSDLEAGRHTIKFDRPAYVIQSGVTGATLVETAPFYAIIDVATARTVTITGTEYVDSMVLETADMSGSASANAHTLSPKSTTLVTPQNAGQVVSRLKSFALLKYTQKFRVPEPGFYNAGYVYLVDTINDKKIAVAVERVDIDLANGFVCDFMGSGLLQGNYGQIKIDVTFDASWSVGKVRQKDTGELLCDTTGVNNLVYYYPTYVDPAYYLRFWVVSGGIEKSAKCDFDFYVNGAIYEQRTGQTGFLVYPALPLKGIEKYRFHFKNLSLL